MKKLTPHAVLPFIILLTITMEVGSADILLPALKSLQDFYQVTSTQIEWFVSANLFALGISSLFYGPLSDRFGRKIIYLIGVSLFTLCAIALCWPHGFNGMLLLRFVQGLGGGACATVGLAILKDQYDSKDYTKTLSWLGTVITASPVIYPLIGSFLLFWGWQTIFYFVAIESILILLLIAKYLPETAQKNTAGLKETIFLYQTIMKNKHFMLYAGICGLTYAAIWVYIAQIALLAVKTYGINPQYLGWILGVSVLFSTLGAIIQTKIANYYSTLRCLGIGILLAFIAAVGMLLVLVDGHSFVIIVGCSSLYWLSNAIVFSNASSLALDIFPKSYGAAASFLTTSELLLSSIAVWLGAQWYNETVMPIVWITLGCALLMSLMFFFITHRPVGHLIDVKHSN